MAATNLKYLIIYHHRSNRRDIVIISYFFFKTLIIYYVIKQYPVAFYTYQDILTPGGKKYSH